MEEGRRMYVVGKGKKDVRGGKWRNEGRREKG